MSIPIMQLSALAAVVFSMTLNGQPGGRRMEIQPVDDFKIRAAGLDPNNENDLLTALRRNDGVGMYASIILGARPGNSVVDGALLEFCRAAKSELYMEMAVNALISHGDFRWVDEVEAKFDSIKNRSTKILLAGDLAEAGRYTGWEFIKWNIITKDQYVSYMETALTQVRLFAGMKGPDGKLVNLSEELDHMHTIAPPEYKAKIVAAMPSVRPVPPKKRGSPAVSSGEKEKQ